MQFKNMLHKCFNCSYRGRTLLPTRIIEPSTHWEYTCLKLTIETLVQGVKFVHQKTSRKKHHKEVKDVIMVLILVNLLILVILLILVNLNR